MTVRILGTLLLVVCQAPAQAGALKHWGFKAGYVSASQKWEHPFISNDDFSRRSGFCGGLFTEWLDHRTLSLSVGVNYERKGTAYTTAAVDAQGRPFDLTFYSGLDYLSVPVLLKVAMGWAPVSPYVLAGPSVDFLLGYSKDDLVWGIEDDYKNVSYGLLGGLGFEVRVSGIGQASIEFVYSYDLSWLYESTMPDGTPFRIKNNTFLISLGLGL